MIFGRHNAMIVAALARRRYPDEELLEMAIRFFLSDRRRAGLGALARGRRGHRKWAEHGNDTRVLYELVIDRPVRTVIEEFEPGFHPIGEQPYATFTHTTLPPFHLVRRLPVHRFELEDQHGRAVVASMLRDLRREMRQEAR